MSNKTDLEILTLVSAVQKYPSVLLQGPTNTCLKRLIQALEKSWQLDRSTLQALRILQHPDFMSVDGAEASPDEVKELRDRTSTMPGSLPFRVMVLYRFDQLHNNAVQSILKVLEEPPPHLRIFVLAEKVDYIPNTIFSRSLHLQISPPSVAELENDLQAEDVPEPAWRAFVASDFPDVSRLMDVPTTQVWHKLWSSILASAPPPTDLPLDWSRRFAEANTETQIACWALLVRMAVSKPSSLYWREIALTSLNQRDRLLSGRANKIRSLTALVHIYAYAKASNKVG